MSDSSSSVARHPITLLLNRVNSGDESAAAELFRLVYDELRAMAANNARLTGPGGLLQATAIVNEAYLKLSNGKANWESRAHFFGAAGRAMRNIVIDQIRKRETRKRGGGLQRIDLVTDIRNAQEFDAYSTLEVNDALECLEEIQPRAARIVELRYFVGLTDEETATALGISVRSVYRDWAFARAWLLRELRR